MAFITVGDVWELGDQDSVGVSLEKRSSRLVDMCDLAYGQSQLDVGKSVHRFTRLGLMTFFGTLGLSWRTARSLEKSLGGESYDRMVADLLARAGRAELFYHNGLVRGAKRAGRDVSVRERVVFDTVREFYSELGAMLDDRNGLFLVKWHHDQEYGTNGRKEGFSFGSCVRYSDLHGRLQATPVIRRLLCGNDLYSGLNGMHVRVSKIYGDDRMAEAVRTLMKRELRYERGDMAQVIEFAVANSWRKLDDFAKLSVVMKRTLGKDLWETSELANLETDEAGEDQFGYNYDLTIWDCLNEFTEKLLQVYSFRRAQGWVIGGRVLNAVAEAMKN